MDLALGRHVHDDIGAHLGQAAEAPLSGDAATRRELDLQRRRRREMLQARGDAVLRELAHRWFDLATPAEAVAAAHRVDVHAEPAGRVEHRRPGREAPSPPRWREDDERVGRDLAHALAAALPARRRLTRRPRRHPRRPPDAPGSSARRRVVAHEDIGGHDRLADLRRHRVRDRRRQAARDRHREERAVDTFSPRQAEADVGGAAGGVDPELIAAGAARSGTPGARPCASRRWA